MCPSVVVAQVHDEMEDDTESPGGKVSWEAWGVFDPFDVLF